MTVVVVQRNSSLNMQCLSSVWSPIASAYGLPSLERTMCDRNSAFNTLRPRQNGRHFADDIFKYIFLNENVWISIKISLKFVSKGPIDDIPALVQIMAWRRPGDKPLSEPMMVSLPTHFCVTRPQWVKRTAWSTSVSQMRPCAGRQSIKTLCHPQKVACALVRSEVGTTAILATKIAWWHGNADRPFS